jgi:hypothetical protein
MTDDLPLAECRLDLPGLRAQRERYRRLAGSVQRLERRPGRLLVEFGADLDSALLDETLAVERECCPFFCLDFVPDERRLIAGVEHSHEEAALDALRFQLAPAEP